MIKKTDNIHDGIEKLAKSARTVLNKLNPDTANILRRLPTDPMTGSSRFVSSLRVRPPGGKRTITSPYDKAAVIRENLLKKGKITEEEANILKRFHAGRETRKAIGRIKKENPNLNIRVGKGQEQYIVGTDKVTGKQKPIFDYDVNYNLANFARSSKLRTI